MITLAHICRLCGSRCIFDICGIIKAKTGTTIDEDNGISCRPCIGPNQQKELNMYVYEVNSSKYFSYILLNYTYKTLVACD